MQSEAEIIVLDTSFLIRLLGSHFDLHAEANAYFDSLIENRFTLAVPVVAIGEYVVKGSKDDLPYRVVRLLPYNLEEALLSGSFAKHLFERRQSGQLDVPLRTIIPNDVKIFATAQIANVRAIVTADEESKKLHTALNTAGLVTYEWWDIRHPLNEYLGNLGL